MQNGSISSVVLVQQAISNAQSFHSLNAFITLDADNALSAAKQLDTMMANGQLQGPLHGIPIVIKDNIHVAGMPNTAGTPALKQFVPNRNAEVVTRLKHAGAIILGKTNMHELAYGVTSDNKAFGSVRNAWKSTHIAGGSSGGTAVAVAKGMGVAGLGTDTGGSSRIPAALNGIVGFRPTMGRYPNEGLTMISNTRDTVGPMANSVEDIILLDKVLSGGTKNTGTLELSGLRIGVPRSYFHERLDAEVAEHMEMILEKIAGAGVELVDADLGLIPALNEKVSFPVVLYETGKLMEAYLKKYLPGVTLNILYNEIKSPDVKSVMGMVVNRAISEDVYLAALNIYRPALQQAYRDYFTSNKLDAVIFPTVPLTARPIAGSLDTVELNGQQVPTFPTYIRNTDPGSNAGIPGLSIPAGLSSEGLPIGIEIDAPENSDARLLAIGMVIEKLIATSIGESKQ